jgi:hypothetical protein
MSRPLRIDLSLLLPKLADEDKPRSDETSCQRRHSDDEHGKEWQGAPN